MLLKNILLLSMYFSFQLLSQSFFRETTRLDFTVHIKYCCLFLYLYSPQVHHDHLFSFFIIIIKTYFTCTSYDFCQSLYYIHTPIRIAGNIIKCHINRNEMTSYFFRVQNKYPQITIFFIKDLRILSLAGTSIVHSGLQF